MKTKLIFVTKTKYTEQWTNLPFIPRLNEWINVHDILKKEEIAAIWKSAHCWSGIRGTIHSIEYRHDDNAFYAEITICCED